MPALPEKQQQIVLAHATLIHRVVMACAQPELRPELDEVLKVSEENGWGALVVAIRQVLGGRRDTGLLAGLDEEDRTIVDSILRGLQDPSTLPDPDAKPDPGHAAPGLAAMIDAAAKGNVQALQLLADMAEQMSRAGGDMTRLGGIMRLLVNGERNADKLTRGMGAQGRGLVISILGELGKLAAH